MTQDDLDDVNQGADIDLRAALMAVAKSAPTDPFEIEAAAEKRWMKELADVRAQHALALSTMRDQYEASNRFIRDLTVGIYERAIPIKMGVSPIQIGADGENTYSEFLKNLLDAAEKGCDFQAMLDAIMANDDYRGQWERLVMLMGLTENTET